MDINDFNRNGTNYYRIHALGAFSPGWLDMLSGDWAIAGQPVAQPCPTRMVEQVIDQAALLGVLNHLYDLGLSLLLVECSSNRPVRRLTHSPTEHS